MEYPPEEIDYTRDFQTGEVLCNPFIYLNLENHGTPGIAINSITLRDFLDGSTVISREELNPKILSGERFLSVYAVVSRDRENPSYEENNLPPYVVDFNTKRDTFTFIGYMPLRELDNLSNRKAKEYFDKYFEIIDQVISKPASQPRGEPVPEDDIPF